MIQDDGCRGKGARQLRHFRDLRLQHIDIAAQAHRLLEVATVPATIVNWGGDDPVTDQQMGEYVAELTGVTASFIETPISFDSFWSDNTRREELIGKCSQNWKDGVRDTFVRLGIIAGP